MTSVYRQFNQGGSGAAVGWAIVAIAALFIAGGLALSLVVGRAPVISEWLSDSEFFRRALVVHVVLSLWGWFLAFAVVGRRLADGPQQWSRGRWPVVMAGVGIGAMTAAAFIPGAEPLLVNYIPIVDHGLFFGGLGLFFGAVGLELGRWPRWRPPAWRHMPLSAAIAFRFTAVAFWLGVVVLALSWWNTPAYEQGALYYELLFWGVGHTLVVLSVLVMLGSWFLLLQDHQGRSAVGPRWAMGICAALLLPWFLGPILSLGSTAEGVYYVGFTRLMQWGIAFPVLVAVVACGVGIWRGMGSRRGRWAVATSLVLTVVGFGLGAMIRGSDTMIPAHYHANLGAITVVLMAVSYRLVEAWGWAPERQGWGKWSRRQPLLFGLGQIIFALGFAISGAFGAARKTYSTDQIIDSTGALIGLGTMGIGGVIAIIGGGLFVGLIAVVFYQRLIREWRLK